MSSKILRPDQSGLVNEVQWRPVGGHAQSHQHTKPASQGQHGGSHGGAPEAMMAELEREMQARAQAAYQQGRSEGEAAGVQQAAQRVDGTVAQLANLMRELGSHKARLRMELEEDTVKLAIAIARRVLNRELATDPDVILGLVKAAFAKLNAREAIRLRVSPPDAAVLQQHRPKLDLPPALEIAGDTSLGVGSVIFETTRGQLDASVDTQLGEIERGLADVMHRKSGMKEIR